MASYLTQTQVTKHAYVDDIFRAVSQSNVKKTKELLLAGVTIHIMDNEQKRNTLLHVAARYADSNMTMFLLHYGANINAVNMNGSTPLHDAIGHSNVDVAEVLINYGANKNIRPHAGRFIGKSANELLQEPRIKRIFQTDEYCDQDSEVQSCSGSTNTDVEKSQDGECMEMSTPKSNVPFESIIGKLKHLRMNDESIRPTAYAQEKLNLLWPTPKNVTELTGPAFLLAEDLYISVRTSTISCHKILDVWNLQRSTFLAIGINVVLKDVHPNCIPYNDAQLECYINPDLFPSKNFYQIHILSDRISITSSDLPGLHYALSTFTQLIKLNKCSSIPPVLIQDYPTISHRAALLDLSLESRVPIMDHLFDIVDNLSFLKMNYVHLFIRFSNSSSWQQCYEQCEIVHLDRYTKDRFINLIPVLEVSSEITDDMLQIMWPVFQKFLSTFSSLRYVHIGPYLSAILLSNVNSEPLIYDVYHLLNLNYEVTVMLCTNELNHCKVIPRINNSILMNYDFQNGSTFADAIDTYSKLGFLSTFCVGTASWNNLAGCPEVCVLNIWRGVRAAMRANSVGVAVANWPGFYLITSDAFAWPGFLTAAGLCWNTDTKLDNLCSLLPALLDQHIFQANDPDSGVGHIITHLGHLECEALRKSEAGDFSSNPFVPPAGSVFYQLLTDPNNVNVDVFNADFFVNAHKTLKKAEACLSRANLKCNEADHTIQELHITIELMTLACKIGRGLSAMSITTKRNVANLPSSLKTELVNKLLSIRELYSEVWLKRNISIGLKKSSSLFDLILNKLVPGSIK